MKGYFTPALLMAALSIAGCELSLEDKEKLDSAAADLQRLADQIIITYPAKDSEINESMVTVRADIPESAQAQEVRLLVDGIEIARDSDGAPWEIQWPAYYFADGGKHTLLLKTITGEGNEVRNNEQFQLTVNEEANKALAFSAGVDSAQIQDQDTFTVGFSAFPEASGYEIKYDGKTITTNSTEVELTELNIGLHNIQYRALHSSLSNTPFSNPVNFEVLAPALPILKAPVVQSTDEGYQVTLSWQAITEGDRYEVQWGTDNNLVSAGNTANSSLTLTAVELGNYQYTLTRTNSLGQTSTTSTPELVGVGIFRTQLGGSQDDRARQIIKSKQGGYLIRATTASYEVSPTLNGTDDWIIRLNEQGIVENEFVSNAGGGGRFYSMIEAVDGSIYLAGQNWDTKEAVITKLNTNLEKQWETLYRPPGITERYDFINLVEWSNKLYVSAAQWKTTGSTSSRDSSYLHEINTEDGTEKSNITLPIIEGTKDNSYKGLLVSSSNKLVIGGYAYPLDREENDYFSGGAFLMTLNSSFELQTSWHNVGKYRQGNDGSITELTNGRFAVVGQGIMGGEPSISIINHDGSEYRHHQGSDNFYGFTNLEANEDGGFYGFFKDQDLYSYPYPMQLMEFNENAIPVNTQYLLNEGGYTTEAGIIKNNDSSVTILFGAGQNEYKNYDIVIKRIPVGN